MPAPGEDPAPARETPAPPAATLDAVNRNPPRHRPTAAAVLIVAAALTAACGAPPPAPTPAVAASGSGTTGTAAPGTAEACAAYADMSVEIPPGVEPGGPPPAPEAMRAWAGTVAPAFAVFRAGAPADLADHVAVLDRQLAGAQQGQGIDPFDPAGSVASNAIGAWAHADCGFPTVDVSFDGTGLSGAPESVPAGPVAVEFRSTDPARPGFVLLVGRIADGQRATAADVDGGRVQFDAVATVATAALPTGPEPAYSVAVLRPGPHLLTVPLGTPPEFTGSTSLDLAVG